VRARYSRSGACYEPTRIGLGSMTAFPDNCVVWLRLETGTWLCQQLCTLTRGLAPEITIDLIMTPISELPGDCEYWMPPEVMHACEN